MLRYFIKIEIGYQRAFQRTVIPSYSTQYTTLIKEPPLQRHNMSFHMQ